MNDANYLVFWFKWIFVNIGCQLNGNFENEVFGIARFRINEGLLYYMPRITKSVAKDHLFNSVKKYAKLTGQEVEVIITNECNITAIWRQSFQDYVEEAHSLILLVCRKIVLCPWTQLLIYPRIRCIEEIFRKALSGKENFSILYVTPWSKNILETELIYSIY